MEMVFPFMRRKKCCTRGTRWWCRRSLGIHILWSTRISFERMAPSKWRYLDAGLWDLRAWRQMCDGCGQILNQWKTWALILLLLEFSFNFYCFIFIFLKALHGLAPVYLIKLFIVHSPSRVSRSGNRQFFALCAQDMTEIPGWPCFFHCWPSAIE